MASTQQWLEGFLATHGAVAGTVHHVDGRDLVLTAAHNIPPEVVAVVQRVAHGKGMAGLAQVRREPVQTCNLQTDTTGRINPMAKRVGGQGAIAIPVLTGDGEVRAVVGLAFAAAGEIPKSETDALAVAAASVP